MTSSLTWLDYSERDRRRALDVIDLFRETSTVDELGLATVRNSFSNLFFPGTSTVQTRACYFLLVPWTFLRLERLRTSSNKVEARARRAELNLSRRMLGGDDTLGVFGSQAGDALKRLPSEVYWGGLGSWGICTFSAHKWAYFRSLDGFYRRGDRFRSTLCDPEGRSAPPANWHPHVPDPPLGFPYENVSAVLRRQDAEYLQDRIQARHPDSLLAVLAGRANPVDLQAHRPWHLSQLNQLTPALREQLRNAELFAVYMQGAVLLYNLMLSELREHGEWTEEYRRRLEDWAAEVDALRPAAGDWRPDGVWRVVRASGRSLGYPTRLFVERWVEDLGRGGPRAVVADNSTARTLVKDREVQLKRARARLTNSRRLELWGGDSGTGRMAYRWGAAKRILTDIFDGLTRGEGDARHA
ncbi:MAG: DUF6361 family protein [Bryobacterales bacterium]|nr:DUF6361 family protein [Bryobacterales bacterium]MDE0336414.1 DUF6361 family protein [Caldilineaceae bacterium]